MHPIMVPISTFENLNEVAFYFQLSTKNRCFTIPAFLALCCFQIWRCTFSSLDSTQHLFVLLHQTAPHCPAIHQASQLSSILFPAAPPPPSTEWGDRYNWWPARTVPTPLCSSSHHRCRRAITFPHHCVHPVWSYQCSSVTCVALQQRRHRAN